MRDISDIVLHTLIDYISKFTFTYSTSGIPSGDFWLQYPNNDYVNERTFQNYPSVGVFETGHTKTIYDNYGCVTIGASGADGSYTIFSPLGRKTFMVQVDLWCRTQSERRYYKNLLDHALLEAKFLPTINDPASGDGSPANSEYIGIKYKEYELSEDKPYSAHFYLEVTASIFHEEQCYIIDDILIRSVMGLDYQVNNKALPSGNNWMTINSGGLTTSGKPDYH